MGDVLSAVVVAAGKSLRFKKSLGSDLSSHTKSKALISLEGAPLIVQTLKALSVLPVSEWIVVVQPEEEVFFEAAVEEYLTLPVRFVYGGARRQDSVRLGLESLRPCDRVFVHDAARPHLDAEFLKQLYEQAKTEDAIIPVMSIVETLKEIDDSGFIVRTHNRSHFVRVQTPQFFRYDLILKAHQEFRDSPIEFTDDAAMLEYLGVKVKTCQGSFRNIKVTTVEDLPAYVS